MQITIKGVVENLLKMKVFITGITSGLGRALSEEFLSKGCSVWGIGRRPLKEPKKNLYYSICDVRNQIDIKRVYEEMKGKDFIPDVVVLNAGITKDDLVPELSYSISREIFEVNLFGVINWINIFLPVYLRKGKGIFVGISSLSAYRVTNINKVAYPASKAALNMIFQALRVKFTSKGLRFIIFCLGRMGERKTLFQTTYQKAAERIANHIYLNRKKNVVNFPFIPAIITRISVFFPDIFISKILSKINK